MEPDMMDTETPNYFSFLGQKAPEKKKRKRGGLAGLWDRNKGAIGSIAGAALGNMLVPGAGAAVGKLLGGAAGGALARGRFDARQAVGDAFMGSGAVNAAGAAKRGLGTLLGRGATQAPARDLALEKAMDVSRPAAQVVSAGATGAGAGASQAMGRLGDMAQRGLGGVLNFVRENPEATGLGLQAISGIMGSQEQRRIEEARLKEERRRAENYARLAMPLYLEGMRGMR